MLNQTYGLVALLVGASLYQVNVLQSGVASLLPASLLPASWRPNGAGSDAGTGMNPAEATKLAMQEFGIWSRLQKYVFGEEDSKSSTETAQKEDLWSFSGLFFNDDKTGESKQKSKQTTKLERRNKYKTWAAEAMEFFGLANAVDEVNGAEKTTKVADEETIEDSVSLICSNADALANSFAEMFNEMLNTLVEMLNTVVDTFGENLTFISKRIADNPIIYFLLSIVTPVVAAFVTIYEIEKRKRAKILQHDAKLATMDGIFSDYFHDSSRKKMANEFLKEVQGEETMETVAEEESQTTTHTLKSKSSSVAILASVVGRLTLGLLKNSDKSNSEKSPSSNSSAEASRSGDSNSEPTMLDGTEPIASSQNVREEEDYQEQELEDLGRTDIVMNEFSGKEELGVKEESGVKEELGVKEKSGMEEELGMEKELALPLEVADSKDASSEVASSDAADETVESEDIVDQNKLLESNEDIWEGKKEGEEEKKKEEGEMKEWNQDHGEGAKESNPEHGAHVGPMGDAIEASFPEELINVAVMTTVNRWKGGIETLV